jgi:putative ABC transport system permease protein
MSQFRGQTVALSEMTAAAHTTTPVDQSILVHASDPAGQERRDAQNWPNLIALVVLLAYIAIAVVNTLVMATAARGREFALLRLVGSGRRQVVRMMRIESLIVIGVAQRARGWPAPDRAVLADGDQSAVRYQR